MAGYRARFGHDALDFSANVSPLGLPRAWRWMPSLRHCPLRTAIRTPRELHGTQPAEQPEP